MNKAQQQRLSNDKAELLLRPLHARHIMCNCGDAGQMREVLAERVRYLSTVLKHTMMYANKCLNCGKRWPTIKQCGQQERRRAI